MSSVDLILMLLSSFLVFFAMTLLVEGCLWVFKIQQPRVRMVCRLLPILKLPFNLLFSELYYYSLFNSINPLNCESYLQQFILGLFQAESRPHTLSHFIATQIPSLWLKIFLVTIFIASFWVMGRSLLQFFSSLFYVKALCLNAEPCQRPIFNPQLQDNLKQLQAEILTSKTIHVPISLNRRTILFPQTLAQEFSQEEFEAVVAHELEHLRWHDPIVKLASSLIGSFFWWIPIQWWQKKLENEQEQACDASVGAYGLDRHALATAIYKVIGKAHQMKEQKMALCCLATPQGILLQRLHLLLEEQGEKKQSRTLASCALGVAFGFFMLLSFCIC